MVYFSSKGRTVDNFDREQPVETRKKSVEKLDFCLTDIFILQKLREMKSKAEKWQDFHRNNIHQK